MTENATTNRINTLLKSNHLPHTLIIEGDGDKKLDLSVYVAKSALCKENIACNNCKGCHLADVGTHPDIKIISTEKRNFPIDDIKEIRKEAFLTPFMAEGRVFIIKEAEKLSIAGQNLLLKTLEEPPKGVHFILVTDNTSALLDTVKSRAVTFVYDGSNEDKDLDLKQKAQEVLNYAQEKNRYKIVSILTGLSDRQEVQQFILLIKDEALNMLKEKQLGKTCYFSDNKLNNIIINLETLRKKLVLNPPLKLVFALVSEYLTKEY